MDFVRSLFSSLSFIQLFALVLVVFFVWKFFTSKRYRLPPGPPALPFLGNIREFKGTSVIEVFADWAKKYGPVVTGYLGPKRVIVLNSYEAVTEALVQRGSDFSGRPQLYSLGKFSEGFKNISAPHYSEFWKYHRRVGVQALRQFLTGTQLEKRTHASLQQVIEVMLAEKGAFDPYRHLSLSVFNIIHGLCFGETLKFTDPKFKRVVSLFDEFVELFDNGFAEDFIPLLRCWPTKRFQDTMKLADEANLYIHKGYAEREDKFDADNRTCLSDEIIWAHQTLKEENPAIATQFTKTHAVQTVNDVFGAGIATSRDTLTWFFLLMGAHPEVQKRIQEEIDEVVGKDVPGREHRAKLVYLEAALLEAMRLHFVAPMGVPHETMRDTTVGGYEIPAGTLVIVNVYGIMRDSNDWEDPLTYKPERFMNKDQTSLVVRHKGFLPFSMGHRSCMGESLAKLELVYIVAGLLQVLSFSLPPGAQPDFTNPRMGFNNVPKPYQLIVTKRGEM